MGLWLQGDGLNVKAARSLLNTVCNPGFLAETRKEPLAVFLDPLLQTIFQKTIFYPRSWLP